MNATVLLMTSALIAGDHHEGHAVPAAPAVVANGSSCCGGAAPVYHGSYGGYWGGGGGYDECCEEERQGLFSRLRNKFKRGDDCCEVAPDCGCAAPVTDCCGGWADECDKPGLLDRIRGLFNRGDDCCEAGYGSTWGGDCGCGHGYGAAPYHHGGVYPAPVHGAPGVAGQPGAQPVPGGDTPAEEPKDLPMGEENLEGAGNSTIGLGTYPSITPARDPRPILPLAGSNNPF